MNTDPSTRYRLDPHARFRVLDDEGIFILQEAGEVLVVNEVAAFLIDELNRGRTFGEAVDAITREFDVGGEQARADAASLVGTLIQAGALEPA